MRPRLSLIRRKPNSPASGSGESANHSSITGSRVRWMSEVRETPLVSASRWRSAALRVGVAERGQPGLGRLQRQPGLVAGELGDGAEQRAVEELLVQPAHLAAVVAATACRARRPVLGEEPDRAAEPAQRRLVLGHDVRAPQLVAAGSGARGCAGTRRPRAAPRRPRGRRSRPRSGRASALSVAPARSDVSARPCTSCRSCTANSTSRSPPEPSLSCRSASWAGMWSSTRRRIACTSSTKPSRSAALHTIGAIIST